jgi:diguanylate cyclase (GGDEF)-like protein/PAS domain S-box-containing protein
MTASKKRKNGPGDAAAQPAQERPGAGGVAGADAAENDVARAREQGGADEAYIEVDLDGLVTRWSGGAQAIFGYEEAEMLGRSVARLLPADKLAEPRALLARIVRRESVLNLETLRVAKSGKQLYLVISYSPVTGPGGAVVAMAAVARLAAQPDSAHHLNARLAAIIESTDDAVISKKLDGTVLSWNPAAERLFGYSAVEMIGRSIKRLFPPERDSEEDLLVTSIARGERIAHFETVRVRKDGTPLQVSVTLSPLRDEQGRIIGASKIARDITERQRMVAALAEQSERFRVTLRSIADAVISTDARGNIDFVNPVAQRLTGWTQPEALGRPIEQVFHVIREQTGQPADNPVRLCLANLQAMGLPDQTLLVCRDGSTRCIEDSAAPIFDAQGVTRGAVLVFHDVSEQRRMATEMQYQATHDPLTSLLNRAEFEAIIDRRLKETRTRDGDVVLYIDLDQFKLINDACGHASGDRLLQQIAALIMMQVSPHDTVARLGGDEFGVLLYGREASSAQSQAWKICSAVDDFRFTHDGRQFRIGASIGLVPLDGDWPNSVAILQAADAACYAAKDEGRNRVHSWYDLDKAVRARKGEMELVNHLSEVLESGRLKLYAQKIVPAGGETRLQHFEVLVRVPDANGRLTTPGSFLPAAERYQLATRVDRWVTQAVFGWMASNPDAMESIGTVAVNLSGQSIGDRGFHRTIIEALARPGFDTRKLCLEITETAAITHLADATEFITQLRALGVRIALDDFGAGASYFGYLKSVGADYLKIDGQFVQDIVDDKIDQAAVRCFCDIARSVGMQTIAECVESEGAAELLRSLGVNYLQGFHFHRPEPLERALAARQSASSTGL